ncbi:Cullin [Hyaloraphidium curvatum]|nr:Cullin [Hyaloraphidium curvatum]
MTHDDLVTAYAREWGSFSLASQAANQTCDYLNRMVLKTRDRHAKGTIGEGKLKRQSVEALAFSIWKERIVHHFKRSFGNRLIFQILELVRKDREGDVVPLAAIATCVRSLVELNKHTEQPLQLYIDEFERLYLRDTRAFYEAESARIISSVSVSSFMAKANSRLEEEVERSKKICDRSSFDKVGQYRLEYVSVHQAKIQSEFETMVADERFDDCTLAFSLLSRIPDGVKPLLEIYERFIITTGKAMIAEMSPTTLKEPKEYVVPLLGLHRKYMEISGKAFLGSGLFVAAVDKAFRAIINDTTTNPNALAPEVLARYCDVLLRKGSKDVVGDSDYEPRMLDVIVLFKYVDDKDVFQKFYSRMLAKRLIYGSSATEEAEASMINHLKNVCGVEYTSKLQRMFTDMAVNDDLNGAFRQHLSQGSVDLGVDFELLILTAGSWPFSGTPTSAFSLPAECEKSVSEFTQFYNQQHNGRKLSWLHNLSKADLKLWMPDKKYELNCSLFQAGILLQFNDTDSLTIEDLRAATSLNDTEMKRSLKALADVKLVNVALEDTLQPTTIVTFNPAFTNKRTKLRLTATSERDTPQETETARQGVDEDRRLYIQAAIVRIMKARKELTHTMLVQEVIDHAKARFAPSVPMIKKSIEQLIDKQYLERADHRDKYRYVA